MSVSVEIIKNTLPYLYPYSVIAIDSSTNEKIILGQYKNKKDTELARTYFDSRKSKVRGIEQFRNIKKNNNIKNPIEQLEKRMTTYPDELPKPPKKRKIILD